MANDISKDLQQICKVLSALNTNVLGLVRETKLQNETIDKMAATLEGIQDILDKFELEEVVEPREVECEPYIDPNYTTYKSTGDKPYDEY